MANLLKKKCSFCGKSLYDLTVRFLGEGQEKNVCICDKCIEILYDTMQERFKEEYNSNLYDDIDEDDISKILYYSEQIKENLHKGEQKGVIEVKKETKKTNKKNNFKYTPHNVYNELSKTIIGQDQAKKMLSVAISNHMKQIDDESGNIRKSNILLLGPTGTGKTLLAQTLAEIANVPFIIADATSLTCAGYAGEDVENMLVRLVAKADNDIEAAEKGIIYIDEIDKLKCSNNSGLKDISGEEVQNSLLKIIEGSEVTLPTKNKGSQLALNPSPQIIDTKNILFICGGAFEGLFDKHEKNNMIGFNTIEEKTQEDNNIDDKLKDYGFIPELLGRLPIKVKLNELTEENLIQIMKKSKNSVIKEYKYLLKKDNIKLVFKNDAIEEIAHIAINNKTGARSIKGIIDNLMFNIMYDLPDNHTYMECTITKDTLISMKPKLKEIA